MDHSDGSEEKNQSAHSANEASGRSQPLENSTFDLATVEATEALSRAATMVQKSHAHLLDCFVLELLKALNKAGVKTEDCELVIARDSFSTRYFIREKGKA